MKTLVKVAKRPAAAFRLAATLSCISALSLAACSNGSVSNPVPGGGVVPVGPAAVPGIQPPVAPGEVVTTPGVPVTTPGVPVTTPGVPVTTPGVTPVDPTAPPVPGTPVGPTIPLGVPGYSPLAQLTNNEFVSALADVLNLSEEQISAIPASQGLTPDPESGGLKNAANKQNITQLAVGGYATLAAETAKVFLGDVNAQSFRDKLGCDALGQGQGNYSSEQCTRDFGVALMQSGYRGLFEDEDAASLDALLTQLDQLIAMEGPGTPDGANAAQVEAASLSLRFVSVVQMMALSPKFLFLLERGQPDPAGGTAKLLTPQELANRLAFFASGGPPTETLVATAASGGLNTPQGRADATDALLATPEAAAGAVEVLMGWLGIDPNRAEEASILALRAFLDDWVVNNGAFSDLFSAPFPVEMMDGTTADMPFGVLGSRAVVASHTSAPTASFINRGEFITERLLCAALPEDLPDAALADNPEDHRDIFFVHAKDPCATCHVIFDNYGAAMEKFDLETSLYNPNAETLADDYALFTLGDINNTVSDAAGLGAAMSASRQAQDCMARLWYRQAVRRDLLTDNSELGQVSALVDNWSATGDTSIRSLLRTIAASENFARIFPER